MKKLALVVSGLILSSASMAGLAIPVMAYNAPDGYPPGYVVGPAVPVPELPAGLLFGMGLLGIGVYLAVKKYRKAVTAK